MITDISPEWDEAAALEEETQWAQKQNDRNGNSPEIINTGFNPLNLTAPDEATMEEVDDEWLNSLKGRNV